MEGGQGGGDLGVKSKKNRAQVAETYKNKPFLKYKRY